MAKNKIAIQFICYSPRIYSGFDKFNLVLACVLKNRGIDSVFVFSDKIEVKALIDDLIAQGVTIELISTKNKLTIFRDIFHLFIKYKPAIVHAHFENYIQLLCTVLSMIFGSKCFISFHSIISFLSISEYRKRKGVLKSTLLRVYYKFLIAASVNVLCISNAIKNQFNVFSASDSSKIKRLYLGVAIQPNIESKRYIRSFLSLPNDKILLCNVSAIEPIKGLDILIKAVGILKYHYNISNFKVCHIGGLRTETEENILYRNNLYSEVKAQQLDDVFLWLGHRNDVCEILAAFEVYVHPSRMEGLGVAIMEACSQSLPIIGTRIGGIPEIVHNEINGYLFTSESEVELANAMKRLIEDRELRLKMGEDSFRIVNENFNKLKQINKLISLYLG